MPNNEPSTTHFLESRANAKAKYFNAGRENGPWSVRRIDLSLLKRYGTFYTYPEGTSLATSEFKSINEA